MPSQTKLEFASHTDTGLVRSHNEDAIAICPELGLAILADGMGGYNAGEVASKMSVDVVAARIGELRGATWFPHMPWKSALPMRWIQEAVTEANTQVIDQANQNPENFGMGTTIVVALCYFDRLIVGHVGDSRAYRFRNGALELITHDHSVLQSQIDACLISPAEAQFSHIKNLITRAFGWVDEIEVDVYDHDMKIGDVFMLCFVGLTD